MIRSLLVLAVLLAPAAVVATEPPPDALVGEIPFEPDSPPTRVMVDLAPEGQQPFVMLLDTGASNSVVTPRVARELGVSVRRTKSSAYRKGTRLGRDLQFWVADSSSDTGAAYVEYGLLGGEFLDEYVLEIDYPGRMVRFYDPRRFEVPERVEAEGEAVIPFRRQGTRILAEIEIEGTPVLSLLDTGAPALIVGGRSTEKIGIDWKGLPPLEGIRGTRGPIEAYTYEARMIRLAGFEFPDQPLTVAPRGNYNQGAHTEVTLGYDLLSRFVLRIDYSNRRLWLRDSGYRRTTYWGGAGNDPIVSGGVPVPVPVRPPPTEDEVAEDDARRVAEWKKRRNERVYAETSPGKFVVVDGWRLRQGPKDGEVWYSHDEMLARKQAVEAGAD